MTRREFVRAGAIVTGGALLAPRLFARVAFAQDAQASVDVWLVGTARRASLEQSIRGATSSLAIDLRSPRAEDMTGVSLRRDARATVAVVVEANHAVVYRFASDGAREPVRRIPARRGLDATVRAAIGHVVRTTIEAAL